MIRVAFDVDGTLIDENDQPRWDVIAALRWFASLPDCQVVVWSGSGLSYAKHWGRVLFLPPGIVYWSKEPAPQADICFDDEEVTLAAVNIKV
jgi:hypothetical protein